MDFFRCLSNSAEIYPVKTEFMELSVLIWNSESNVFGYNTRVQTCLV